MLDLKWFPPWLKKLLSYDKFTIKTDLNDELIIEILSNDIEFVEKIYYYDDSDYSHGSKKRFRGLSPNENRHEKRIN